MVDKVKCHWKGRPEYEKELWSCWHGSIPYADQCSHISRCTKYLDLRENLLLDRDDHLVLYFRRVIERREEEEKQEEDRRQEEERRKE